jgi:hypothetical protein
MLFDYYCDAVLALSSIPVWERANLAIVQDGRQYRIETKKRATQFRE